MKEYKVVSDRYIEHLVDTLNEHGNEGWTVVTTIQEQGTVKVILERDSVKKENK